MCGKLWQLLRLPYGIPEAGRQWALVMEFWMLNDMRFQRVRGASQLYIERDREGNIILIITKVTDDILMADTIEAMYWLSRAMHKIFGLSKLIIDETISYNGCRITQTDDRTTYMGMTAYLKGILPIDVPRNRRKQYNSPAKTEEINSLRHIHGSLMWIGKGTMPQASLVGSLMQ